MTKPLSLFVPLTKVDEEKRLVYGVATAEQPDRSGEICDYETTKPFYEKWSGEIAKASGGKSLGNIRAMHGKVAAGKLTSINFNDDAKQIEICAKVVDDNEWKKVLEGVYTGFSQGGAYAKTWKDPANPALTRYTASPSEVSLVDLACLPACDGFTVVKADGTTELRKFADKAPVEVSLVDHEHFEGSEIKAGQQPDSGDVEKAAGAEVTPDPELTAAEKALAALDQVEKAVQPAPASLFAGDLKKSLYSVSHFASILSDLYWLQRDAFDEAAYEGDASPVPAQIRAASQTLASILVTMVIEETTEAFGAPEVEVLEMSAGIREGDAAALVKFVTETEPLAKFAPLVEKVGARNSKNDQANIQAAHDATVKAGATCATEKAHGADDLGKLAKAEADRDAANAALEKITPRIEALTAQIEAMQKRVMPAKSAGTAAVVAVTKSQDAQGLSAPGAADVQLTDEQVAKVLSEMDPGERALLLTKAALKNPIMVSR